MNNDNYELLGFDIRLSGEDYVEVLWNQKRRDIYLLKPEINWPLSVDTMVWPSLFRYLQSQSEHSYFKFNDAINVIPRNARHSAFQLWSNLNEMKLYSLKHKNKIRQGIPIGIVLIEGNYLRSDKFWSAVLDPPLSIDELPKDWLFLGYDIADRDMISGLSNCGYDHIEKASFQKTMSAQINEYGLLKTLEDAIQFKKISDYRVPSHFPFYVYALFRDRAVLVGTHRK